MDSGGEASWEGAGEGSLPVQKTIGWMALNPHAKPFIFKPAAQHNFVSGALGASPANPLSSDQTLYAANAKLERLTLDSPAIGPGVDETPTQSTNRGHGEAIASEAPRESEELTFDDMFEHGVAEDEPAFSHSRAEVRPIIHLALFWFSLISTKQPASHAPTLQSYS